MILSDIFPLFLAQNFKTKVLTAQKSLLLDVWGEGWFIGGTGRTEPNLYVLQDLESLKMYV